MPVVILHCHAMRQLWLSSLINHFLLAYRNWEEHAALLQPCNLLGGKRGIIYLLFFAFPHYFPKLDTMSGKDPFTRIVFHCLKSGKMHYHSPPQHFCMSCFATFKATFFFRLNQHHFTSSNGINNSLPKTKLFLRGKKLQRKIHQTRQKSLICLKCFSFHKESSCVK